MHFTRRSITSVVFLAIVTTLGSFAHGQAVSADKERELIALLRSDAPKGEKAVACKQLSLYGSSEAVPELAKFLTDEQLASWARIALEAIPGSAADEALRKATESAQGNLLIGVINSIGVRRDAGAVNILAQRLKDGDAEVASAAAVALGHIGNDAAAKSLRPALAQAPVKVRSAVAEGCVLCAEHFLAAGNATESAAIYDEVRKAEVPKQRILEATRGAILARKQDGIPLLLEQLRSPDRAFFQIGLGTTRELPGNQIDAVLATEIERAAPDRAARIIQAMADRKDTVVLSAVLKAATTGGYKEVRLSAISALGHVGNATCLSPLLQIALESDADLVQTAKESLADLPDASVDQEILAQLPKSQGKMYPLLIELVGTRRIAAIAMLVKALDNSDKTVRSAALLALGNTVSAKDLSVLISQVTAPKHADDATVAQQALKTAAVRMPDREACATELVAVYDRAPVATKIVLLEILGSVAGTKALNTIGAAAKSNDPQLQDVASRVLGEWMSVDAAPVLLDLSKTAPGEKYQVRAIRGYIRIARQFTLTEKERIEMCRLAFDAAKNPAEKRLVFEVLKRYPSVESLKIAVQAAQVPELKAEAADVAQAIAPKITGKKNEVQEILSKAGLDKVKL